MNKKAVKILSIFIIIIALTFLACGIFNRPMDLSLPGALFDGDSTLSSGEGVVQIYDYEKSDLIIKLEIVPADEDNPNNNNNDNDDLTKLLIIPAFVTIPEDELSVKFTCQAVDSDMSPETVKDITVRAFAEHYQDTEDTVAINDVEPEPTHEPTAPPAIPSPGAVWLEPTPSGTITNGSKFKTEVHCNSGTQRLAAYNIDFSYNESIIIVDTTIGTDGVEDGPDDFSGAPTVTNTDGKINVTNSEENGITAGTDLHILTINWTAVSQGSAIITITVNNLADEDADTIGTPTGIPLNITIEPSKKGHY
ncbi:MAG: hypothetical protein JXJ04_23135 [Spirochaetales bacterium]|nr:hypothetical protein [Spirochaetales bacterium]